MCLLYVLGAPYKGRGKRHPTASSQKELKTNRKSPNWNRINIFFRNSSLHPVTIGVNQARVSKWTLNTLFTINNLFKTSAHVSMLQPVSQHAWRSVHQRTKHRVEPNTAWHFAPWYRWGMKQCRSKPDRLASCQKKLNLVLSFWRNIVALSGCRREL